MRRVLLALLLVVLSTVHARATPFFARQYGFSCQTCHRGYPRLNAFGQAFKANNFRIPGMEKKPPMAWQKTVPIAFQILPVYQRSSPRPNVAQYTDTQLLAGGLLTPRTAFYLHHSAWIDDLPLQFPGYEVWMQHVLDERHKILLKVGQFELPYAYSPAIHLTTPSAPGIFGAGLFGNDVRLGSAMRGLQMSGNIGKRLKLEVAAGAPSVFTPGNTVGKTQFFGEFPNLFLRLSNRNTDRHLGLFAYLTHAPRNRADATTGDNGQRYGIEGSLLWRGYQFSLMGVYGQNDNPTGKGGIGSLHGGFVEVDRMFLPWLGFTARWETQTIDVGGTSRYSDARVLSLRFLPRPNFKLGAEYRQADHNISSTSLFASLSF